MKKLVNKARRRLGIPGRPAIILEPNGAAVISDDQLDELVTNRTVARWVDRGVLVVLDENENDVSPDLPKPKPRGAGRAGKPTADYRPEPDLPEGVAGEGTEIHHLGGGWYAVYVNGFKVTDRNVRKDEAEEIAKDYD